MTLTITEARDAVVGVVQTAWDASAVTAAIPMQYDDVVADKPGELDPKTSQAQAYARTTVRHISGPQSTQGSQRRFLNTGIVTVQIFAPTGGGNTAGDAYAQVVLDALRAHVGGVSGLWIFDTLVNEIGVDGPWFQTNVAASFRYQEAA